MSYAVKFTAPVYVVFGADGEVERVVVEDDQLSSPLALVPSEVVDAERGWNPEQEIPWDQVDQADRDQYTADNDKSEFANAWEFGW